MKVFNSIGSNYTWGFAWRSLVVRGKRSDTQKLLQELAGRFEGRAALTYKGRQALELALVNSGLPKGSSVAINGLTCYVVYQAVEAAGYVPVLVDLAEDSLHFDAKGLEALTTPPQAVIVQNTLGFPCDIAGIERYCIQQGSVLIEDLAHSFDMSYPDGRKAGTVGSFVMLTFSQNKMPDVVAGGALIDRRNLPAVYPELPLIKRTTALRNRLFPLLSVTIRSTYGWGVGKILHKVLYRLNLLSNPMHGGSLKPSGLDPSSAGLLLGVLKRIPDETVHRKKISDLYRSELPSEIQLKNLPDDGVPVRYPLLIRNRASLWQYLKKHGIYIASDTWFDSPLAPKGYISKTSYKQGDCPTAEVVADQIVNLPTHINVNEKQARFIAGKVKEWLKLQ